MVIPDDGGAAVGCFGLSEPHFGEEATNPVISEPALLGFAMIESIGNDFDRKNAVFYLRFKPQDGILNLIFQAGGL